MRLIDANALKKAIGDLYGLPFEEMVEDFTWLKAIDNAPTVEPTFKPIAEVKFDKEQLQEIVDKAKAEVLASVERPQGEWIDANKQIPEDCITVLIWFEYYRYGDYNCMYQTFGLGYTIDGKWSPFINGETGWRDAHIIAWQPIEPYEADMRGERS